MKISELDEENRLKALEYQRNEKDFVFYFKYTNELIDAFDFKNTKEGYDYWCNLNNEEPEDKNVRSVIKAYEKRSKVGFNKYGVTTERKDIDLLGWLQHLQEELMDATIYIERLKNEIK